MWSTRPYGNQLSPREIEVLQHLVKGENDIQIGIALGVGDSTIRQHVLRVKKKLHVNNRVSLALKAIKIVEK